MSEFDVEAVDRQLLIDGLTLERSVAPEDLGKGRWRVVAVSRVRRDPAGTRVVRRGEKGWELENAPPRGDGPAHPDGFGAQLELVGRRSGGR